MSELDFGNITGQGKRWVSRAVRDRLDRGAAGDLSPGSHRRFSRTPSTLLTLGILAVLTCAGWVQAEQPSLAVKAARIYVGNGRVIQEGVVWIDAGRIRAVGDDLDLPPGTRVVQFNDGHVTAGLIDANARVDSADSPRAGGGRTGYEVAADASDDAAEEPSSVDPLHVGEEGEDGEPDHGGHDDHLPLAAGVASTAIVNEQSSEVVPQTRVLDGIDLRSVDFERLVRGGVTTVYASPDASAVIGPRGAVLHTAGPLGRRVLVPVAAVKATIGSDPSSLGTYNRSPSRTSLSMYARRPNSRMGLVWVFRKAFYDAMRQRDGLPTYGSDTAEPEALGEVLEILKGTTPLRIQARIQRDILAALRLADEFDLEFTLEEATEAYRCLDELQAASTTVVFGPIYERPSGLRATSSEARRSRYFTFRALLQAGIPTALSAQELRDEDGLARQAMYAQRFGVSFDQALDAVTRVPAEILGLDDQLGTLEAGKRADLVIWNGKPLAATSRPEVVFVDGEIVVDRR